MTARTGILVVAITTVIGVTGVLWNHRRLERTRESAPAVQLRVEDDHARALNRARMRLAGAELARDEQGRILEGERRIPPTQGSPVRLPGSTDTFQRMLDDPEVRVLLDETLRAPRAVTYGALVKQLDLSPEQAAEFDRLIAEHETEELDAYAAGRAQGLPKDDAALKSLDSENEAELEQGLRALLGDNGYAVFREYDRTAALRMTVSGFAATATAAGEPLSPAQAEALVHALAASIPGHAAGQRAKPSLVDWTTADAQLQAILTPAQWEVIRSAESNGAKGVGGRFFPRLTKTIREAREADAAAPTP